MNEKFFYINFRKAEKKDAELLIQIYNASFYEDFVRFGECPAYGKTKEAMEESIAKFPKSIIISGDIPIGVISVQDQGNGEYYLDCLCIVPEYQGKGIGTQAVRFMLEHYREWNRFTLITPADKKENVAFYTRKCGFHIIGPEMDGHVKVLRFEKKR